MSTEWATFIYFLTCVVGGMPGGMPGAGAGAAGAAPGGSGAGPTIEEVD